MNNRGFAAILIIFILSLASILVASGLVLTGYNESQMARSGATGSTAFYAANAGIEDAIYKLNTLPHFAETSTVTYSLPVGTGNTSVTITPVTGNIKQRTVDAVGTVGLYTSRIRAILNYTIVTPGFLFAMQSGTSGIEIEQQSSVSGVGGVDGNIYSAGDIKGKDNNHNGAGNCQNSSSQIIGSATAHTNIDRLAGGTGICVVKDATANNLKYCYVDGTRNFYSSVDTTNCSGNILPPVNITPTPAPTPIPLPDMGVEALKATLTTHGDQWTANGGNCDADGSNSPADCTKGTKILKNIVIHGNLIIDPPTKQTISIEGPVLVTGDVTIKSNSSTTIPAIQPANVAYSQMLVAEGKIISDSGVTFGTSEAGTIFLLFISEYVPPSPYTDLCDTPAMTIHSNTFSVLFYGSRGCAVVVTTASTAYQGALVAEKIHLSNNSNIVYDPKLKDAKFATTALSGWQIASFKEL